MLAKHWIHLAELTIAILLALAVYFSWRADQRDRAQLSAELAATKQLLAAADARQHDRDAQLAQTLATLAAEKRTIVTSPHRPPIDTLFTIPALFLRYNPRT